MNDKCYEVLQRASLFLEKAGREPKVAEILLLHHLQITKEKLLMRWRDSIDKNTIEAFEKDIFTHVETGVPVQHLTKVEHFYGREFEVNQHVLIPRPETEELVQQVIQQAHTMDKPLTIVDVGTGSGVIAITLALELAGSRVFATDISDKALSVAKRNAQALQAEVTFLEGNFLEPFLGLNQTADIVVSNPPYIPSSKSEELQDTVKNFDPELALFAENNGLAAYHAILRQMQTMKLSEQSILAFEIGFDQSAAITNMIRQNLPSREVCTIKDINEKDRILLANVIKG
ncbi:protein-(glutamine-N5) methyltransferase, release factor-specific [Oceanobacillus sp. E9]|uniref:Release factor glutamine methyltransferase n=1 Tax=Oceanobacillus kimchii TaxID=746691 RepID=A0ABQ5TMY5_9BACI|nr:MULTISPECIES: peptide chain release factor N(5)-glutamine methyltransferase [Oceanobacillus]MBT2599461.1 peptide chain release factor N(5)-glutamine methyltransferase [Oceanobacillus sp. ISL-74]OEH56016.1 protein-(glutamine-N5) methyltransferase, release factor-specific [Oceanobacillus sp. E9]GLO67681.1 release factor glutamine methyltransferase [Oceanobacillus kimchii]